MLVNSEGFEPPTSWAVTRCTIQLCYESAFAKATADSVRVAFFSLGLPSPPKPWPRRANLAKY